MLINVNTLIMLTFSFVYRISHGDTCMYRYISHRTNFSLMSEIYFDFLERSISIRFYFNQINEH